MAALKTALIGCGRIGALLEDDPLRIKPCTHYGGTRAARIRVTHACDIDPQRLALFGTRAGLGASRLYRTHEELLETHRPELVIVATWTPSHADIVMHALKHGARVIVCEKPLCGDLGQAKKLLSACARTGARLVVNHERRFDPRYRAVKRLIEDGAIGEVRTVRGEVLGGPYRGASSPGEGGGPLLHDGTHLIDIIRFLFGDIRSVEGSFSRDSRKRGFEDRALAWMTARNGLEIFIEAGGSRGYFSFELDISGTTGRIRIGNGFQELHIAGKSRLYAGFRDLLPAEFPRIGGPPAFTGLYREARRLLDDPGAVSVSSGLDGYRALEAVHAVYLSAAQGRKRVELPVSPAIINVKDIFGL
ncbi:MAG: Gfo/Idh/MocA family oxidoreductase [Spirochaetes bacterium]|nr:MAG: Gfo/Idh/MocA family oxidoreductase [Spirochaetota bacterium]